MLVRIRAAAIAGFLVCASPAFATPAPPFRQEFQAESRPHDAASVAATAQRVSAARNEAKRRPLQLAQALTQLGDALLAASDHAGAEAAFTEALDLVEQRGPMTSAELFEPLRGLGYTKAARGRHDQAAELLNRALLIARRNFGLFDNAQLAVLQQLALSLAWTGEWEAAERQIKYLLHVGERAHGENHPDLAPTLCLAGEKYAEIGSFDLARESYRRAIDLLSGKYNRMDPRLIEPLRGLARTYMQEAHYSALGILRRTKHVPSDADGSSNDRDPIDPRHLGDEGEEALRRAVRIAEAQPGPAAQQLIDILIQLGDWLQAARQRAPAMSVYRRAAELAEKQRPGETDALVQAKAESADPFGFPVRLWHPIPRLATRYLAVPEELIDETYVELEFTVTREGVVKDARVVGSDCSARLAADALHAIRAARYRPRFVRGEPVDTLGVLYRETFRALKSAEAASGL